MNPLAKLPAPSVTKALSIRHLILTVASALSFTLLHPGAAPAQDLYATNSDNSTITKITPDGTRSLLASDGLEYPGVVAFDLAGNLYVANGDDTIRKIAPDGTASVFANVGSISPSALAFDAAGDLYAASQIDFSIRRYAPDGTSTVFVSAGLNNPVALAFDAAGDLFVADVAGIEKVSRTGRYRRSPNPTCSPRR